MHTLEVYRTVLLLYYSLLHVLNVFVLLYCVMLCWCIVLVCCALSCCRDWGAIFRESSRVLYEEVDYTKEGQNAERFSDNFKGTAWIKAPSINWSRSTSKASAQYFPLQ